MTITWLNDYAGPVKSFNQEILPAFMAEHPNIKVENDAVPFGGIGQAGGSAEKILTTAAGGTGADVYRTNARWARAFIPKGVALRLDDLIARNKFDMSKITPNSLKLFSDASGKVYGLPDEVAVWTTVYAPSLYRDNGVPLPSTTWKASDLLAAAQALTKRSGGKLQSAGWANLPDPSAEIFEGFLTANGGSYLSKDLTKSEINSAQNIEVLQFWGDLQNKYHVIPSAAEWKDLGAPGYPPPGFYDGKVGGFIGGAWNIPPIHQHAHVDLTFHELPQFSQKGNALGGGGEAIFPFTKYPDESFTFLMFYMTPKAQLMIGKATGALPYQSDVLRQYLQALPTPPSDVATMANSLSYAVAPSACLSGKWDTLNQPLQKLLNAAWQKNTSIKDALDEVKRLQDAILASPA